MSQSRIYQMNYRNPEPTKSTPMYQILYCDQDFRIGLHNMSDQNNDPKFHSHNYYEFELIVEGNGTNHVMSQTFDVKRGHFFFLSPSAFHRINAAPNSSMTIINFKLRDGFTDFLLHLFGSEYFAMIDLDDEITENIQHILSDALRNAEQMADHLRRIYMKNTVENILLIFAEHYYRTHQLSPELSEDNDYINAIILDIRQNFASPITLESISKKYGYSPNYISQMIKRTTSYTFKNYVTHLRMQAAYNMIMYHNIPYKQVALEVGYENYTSFLDIFIKKYGIPPSKLRESDPPPNPSFKQKK